MTKKNRPALIALIIAAALISALLLNTWQAFQVTSDLIRSSGRYHLESISGELTATIGEAERLAMKLALQAQPNVWDKLALEEFINAQKKEILAQNNGCFNVYMAGTGWAIIPDFDMPEDYIATEREWYKGARRAQGATYVAAPYVDAMTGNICYSVSVMLGDRNTVLALDYTMDNIQSQITQLYENGSQFAMIVTGDGIIAGCSDENLLGRHLSDALPDYSSILSLVKSRQGFVTTRIKSGVLYENLFATVTGFGWYLIVSENDWEFFREAYLQLIGSALIALMLSVIMVIFYLVNLRRQRVMAKMLAERDRALAQLADQLMEPLHTILDLDEAKSETSACSPEALAMLRTAGRQVMKTLQESSTKAAAVKAERSRPTSEQNLRMNKRFRTRMMHLMAAVVLISIVSNLQITLQWSGEKLRGEVNEYDNTLSEWVAEQKSILDMFCSMISTNPEMLSDYEATVAALDRITQQYPDISASYMTNPNMSPTVIMNNGWQPSGQWHVEERQWYIDTLASESGWTISTPYYDAQTGLYCVTFAERVYNSETGEFLGNFGIDFFIDKLIDILGGSYSDTGYAFLTDTDGVIVNHPNSAYQMTEGNTVNVSELRYGEIKPDGRSAITMRDYDGTLRVITAKRNAQSGFTVYKAVDFFSMYLPAILSELLILLVIMLCMCMVYRLLTALMRWQDDLNGRMKAAADSAIAAGQAKSRFLAQMSHEIRTPINAVLGMNEMILRESGDPTVQDYAANIQTAGKTLLSLINSILDFSKIEEGKMDIVPVEYDATSVINNLVSSVSERARSKQLELIVEVDPNLPARMIGDDVRLSQVIMNLLTNAVKYTERGHVRFSIRGGARGGGQIELKVAVQDTGIGIRQEDLPKLFESFERLDEVRNHNIEGTGLGMAIVTRLLGMMGSRLEVESVYGKGSTFSFAISQGIADETPIGDYSQRLAISRESVGKETFSARDARVLVVDDNEMNLKVAKNLLKLFDIVPDLADSGMEAVDLVREKHYHIVFLDHMMPKMDGVETRKAMLREHLLPEDTAVIVLTANAVNGAKEQYLAEGFDDYLSKPIDVARLEYMLARYLPKSVCEIREPSAPKAAERDEAEDADLIGALAAAGFDTKSGLQYAAGDRQFYLELAATFAGDEPRDSKAIQEDYLARDLENYQIHVHALKSSARQIGANALSDAALQQEMAAKARNAAAVEAGAQALLKQYADTACALRQILDMPQNGEAQEQTSGGEEMTDSACDGAPEAVTIEELRPALNEAAACIENFELERAVELLRPLAGVACGSLALDGPIGGIVAALNDFDATGAGEQLDTLLKQIGSNADE